MSSQSQLSAWTGDGGNSTQDTPPLQYENRERECQHCGSQVTRQFTRVFRRQHEHRSLLSALRDPTRTRRWLCRP